MAQKTLTARLKQKYDTATNWATNNPILLAGELGFESDTNKFKIGDGTTAWNSLVYGKGELPNNISYFVEQSGTPSVSLPYYTKSESDTLYEAKSNKVTSLSSSSTDAQYPSAKCVYDLIGDIETLLAQI